MDSVTDPERLLVLCLQSQYEQDLSNTTPSINNGQKEYALRT